MRLAVVMVVSVAVLPAQIPPAEISVSAGAGLRGSEDLPSGGYSTWTAGGGYRLSDRWILRGEFAQHHPATLNMFHGSLMREGDGNRRRSFVEFGAGVGWHRLRRFPDTYGYLGFFLAAGYTFDIGERYFFRPQLRVHLYGPPYIGVQPALAAGVRF